MKKVFELNGVQYETNARTEEELDDVKRFFAGQQAILEERGKAAELARPALQRLCQEVLTDRSGQCYKVRRLLFSLWNGKPCSLIELLNLDWSIRKDLCQVLLAFGHCGRGDEFFYEAIRAAVKEAGQLDWFLEEADDCHDLQEWVKSFERNRELGSKSWEP